MSNSDEPNNTIVEQLQVITARLERITVAQVERSNHTNQRVGALERRVAELERGARGDSQRGRAATAAAVNVTTATAPQRVSPPPQAQNYSKNDRTQDRSIASGRTRRRARPVTETFVIGDKVYLLDQKRESTPYGSVIGFTRVGWAKILLENGASTIRKTNNITKHFTRSS